MNRIVIVIHVVYFPLRLHCAFFQEILIRVFPTSINIRYLCRTGCNQFEVVLGGFTRQAAKGLPRLILCLVLLALALVPAQAVQAQSTETPQRFATLRLHNLHLQRTAICELTLRSAPNQGADYLHSVDVLPRQVVDVDLVALTAAQGGEFSGIVDCSRPVTSILFYGDRTTQMYGGYTGLAAPDIPNQWHILQAFTGTTEQLSRIVVQNSSATVNHVRLEFLDREQGDLIFEMTLADMEAYSADSLELSQIPSLQLLPDVQVRLTADYPIVPLVFNINANTSAAWHPEAAYESALGVYVPSGRPLTEFYWPSRLVSFHGLSTDLQVLNPGTDPAQVTVQYLPFGSVETEVLPGVVTSLPIPDFVPEGYIAPLLLESDVPIHVVTQTQHAVGRIAVHAGTSDRGRKLSAPLILKNAEGFSSLVSCQNTGLEPAEVIFEYVNEFARVKVIKPGRNTLVNVGQDNLLPARFSGAMIVRSNEPLKCVVLNLRNELLEASPYQTAPADLQTVLMYEALVLD